MVQVKTVVVTPYQQNARILIDEQKNCAVIIDPGGDVSLILDELPEHCNVESIWITHSHIDHVSGVALLLLELKTRQSVVPDVMAHPDDQINRENLPMQSQMLGFPYSGDFNITQLIQHGDIIFCGNYEFHVLHTPGHAIGHVSFYFENVLDSIEPGILIAGDALFKGSIGRTDLPGGNHQQLIQSIQTQIMTLPDQVVVYSGHGENTTIGEERNHNPFLL